MAKDGTAAGQHPALLRLLGTMTGAWRDARIDTLTYLAAQAAGRPDEAEAVRAELDQLLAAQPSEFHCVQTVIEAGANFSPYGEFGTAAEFLRRLHLQLSDPDLLATPAAAADPARAGSSAAGSSAAGQAPRRREDADPFPLLRRVLRALWTRWRDVTDDVEPIDFLGAVVCDLVDLLGVTPADVLAEIDWLLGAGWSPAAYAAFLSDAGAHDIGTGEPDAFLRDLRDRVADLAESHPQPELDPRAVTEATLAALDEGVFNRAMTGLVRRYALPELRTGDLAHFRATVAALLDRVLPQWVERYVDDLCYAAQCVRDELDWTLVRWMRSAVELLLVEYGQTDAAAFVDVDQVTVVDGLLAAPTCRFGPAAGAPAPQLPEAHWWWTSEAHQEAGAVGMTGLPPHLRWYRAVAAWQTRPSPSEDQALAPAQRAKELSTRMIRAGLAAFGGVFHPQLAAVQVLVVDEAGEAVWAAGPLPARVLGERLVVAEADLAGAPAGTRVISSATVRGTVGEVGAAWSVELLRTRKAGVEYTTSGWATLVLDGVVSAADDAALGTALQAWEDELASPVGDWTSAVTPTLIGRYGNGRETFAHDPPRQFPLLTGISRHVWDGDLLPGLAGIARVYASELFDRVQGRPWETDWLAGLRDVGADGWHEFVGRLVRWTRELTDEDWYLLCAARSGIQCVAEELPGVGLASLVRVGRIRTLDDAMRTFGHRFGPIPLAAVPTGLNRRHRWWRYPAGQAEEAWVSCTLEELVVDLRAELDTAERDRDSAATTESLRRVLGGCERVLDGSLTGFRGSDATTVGRLVTDSWNPQAAVTQRVLGYFGPIEHHANLWPLPPAGSTG